METPEVERAHHQHTGRQWLDVVLGVSAVSISFISLFLAIANGHAMERLVQSNSWPFVQVGTSNVQQDGTPHISFVIANKGVGPARVEMLQVIFDGTPMKGPRTLLNALLSRTTTPYHPQIITSTVVRTVLAAKENLTFFDIKPEDLSASDYAAIDVGVQKLEFRTCYCSVFDECWVAESRKASPSKVKECPVSQTAFL